MTYPWQTALTEKFNCTESILSPLLQIELIWPNEWLIFNFVLKLRFLLCQYLKLIWVGILLTFLEGFVFHLYDNT